MRYILSSILFVLLFSCSTETSETASTEQILEASCGQCNFGLDGDGCDLAVKIDGKAYFVEGVDFDNLGDSHAEDGLCNITRKAKAEGKLEGDVFKATAFELLPNNE